MGAMGGYMGRTGLDKGKWRLNCDKNGANKFLLKQDHPALTNLALTS